MRPRSRRPTRRSRRPKPAAKADAKKPAPKKPAAKKPEPKKPAPKPKAEEKPKSDEKPKRRAPRRRRGAEESTPKPKPAARRPVVHAHAKYVRSSARKARLVINHIRGKSVDEARATLQHHSRGVATDIHKLLESAVANAENNHELVADDLLVKEISADEGPTLRQVPPARTGARDADSQTHRPSFDRPDDEGVGSSHGPEDSSRGLQGRVHPRLEVELVQRPRVRRLPARGPRGSQSTSRPSSATPACPTFASARTQTR